MAYNETKSLSVFLEDFNKHYDDIIKGFLNESITDIAYKLFSSIRKIYPLPDLTKLYIDAEQKIKKEFYIPDDAHPDSVKELQEQIDKQVQDVHEEIRNNYVKQYPKVMSQLHKQPLFVAISNLVSFIKGKIKTLDSSRLVEDLKLFSKSFKLELDKHPANDSSNSLAYFIYSLAKKKIKVLGQLSNLKSNENHIPDGYVSLVEAAGLLNISMEKLNEEINKFQIYIDSYDINGAQQKGMKLSNFIILTKYIDQFNDGEADNVSEKFIKVKSNIIDNAKFYNIRKEQELNLIDPNNYGQVDMILSDTISLQACIDLYKKYIDDKDKAKYLMTLVLTKYSTQDNDYEDNNTLFNFIKFIGNNFIKVYETVSLALSHSFDSVFDKLSNINKLRLIFLQMNNKVKFPLKYIGILLKELLNEKLKLNEQKLLNQIKELLPKDGRGYYDNEAIEKLFNIDEKFKEYTFNKGIKSSIGFRPTESGIPKEKEILSKEKVVDVIIGKDYYNEYAQIIEPNVLYNAIIDCLKIDPEKTIKFIARRTISFYYYGDQIFDFFKPDFNSSLNSNYNQIYSIVLKEAGDSELKTKKVFEFASYFMKEFDMNNFYKYQIGNNDYDKPSQEDIISFIEKMINIDRIHYDTFTGFIDMQILDFSHILDLLDKLLTSNDRQQENASNYLIEKYPQIVEYIDDDKLLQIYERLTRSYKDYQLEKMLNELSIEQIDLLINYKQADKLNLTKLLNHVNYYTFKEYAHLLSTKDKENIKNSQSFSYKNLKNHIELLEREEAIEAKKATSTISNIIKLCNKFYFFTIYASSFI